MWCDRCNHFVMPIEDWAGKHCPVRHFSTLTEDRPKTKERVRCSNEKLCREAGQKTL